MSQEVSEFEESLRDTLETIANTKGIEINQNNWRYDRSPYRHLLYIEDDHPILDSESIDSYTYSGNKQYYFWRDKYVIEVGDNIKFRKN